MFKNYNYLNFARSLVLTAYLEVSVSNFIKNTIKIVEPKDLFLGFEYSQMAQRMTENGVLFISGKKEGEYLEYFAAIYKGEVIEEFSKVTKDKFALKYWRIKGEKLVEVLENIVKIKTLNVKPSWLPNRIISVRKNITVTLLGSYLKDTKKVLRDLNYPESINFSAKDGEFNLLNVPDEKIKNFSTFWEDFNQPWLKQATDRGDEIVILSDKFSQDLLYKSSGEITGFGKEIEFMDNLVKEGVYKFIKEEGKYIKTKK